MTKFHRFFQTLLCVAVVILMCGSVRAEQPDCQEQIEDIRSSVLDNRTFAEGEVEKLKAELQEAKEKLFWVEYHSSELRHSFAGA